MNYKNLIQAARALLDEQMRASLTGPMLALNEMAQAGEDIEVSARLLRDLFAALAAPAPNPEPFQQRVQPWMMACFGEMIAGDREERNHRFLEEALELVQSTGCTASEAHQLVDYVYGRPVGEPAQEVGGVMVTLAALCLANNLDMHADAETELARIWTKVDQIRAKQAAKPKHSPLPERATAPSSSRVQIPSPPEMDGLQDVPHALNTPDDWDADYANTWSSLQVALRNKMQWRAYALELRTALAAQSAAGVGEAGALGWKVRERRAPDGTLLDCFVEGPKEGDMAYGLQVLGDDYNGYGDVERKYEHCKMIVAWANSGQSPDDVAPVNAIDLSSLVSYDHESQEAPYPVAGGRYLLRKDVESLLAQPAPAPADAVNIIYGVKSEPIIRPPDYTINEADALPAKAAQGEALEALMMEKRIGVVPEFEGGFNAEIYGDEETPQVARHGKTPSEAVAAALAAHHQQDGGGA